MRDLIVIGAGPCGLSAAVEARARGLDCLTLDRGCLCDAVTRYPTHLTFFSTPDLLEIGGVPFSLDHKPQRHEILTYYRRVAAHFDLDLGLYTPALELRREDGGFAVRVPGGEHRARAVCVATGFFDSPRRLGVPGEDLPHVTHRYTEGHPYFRRDVVVVGTRNSAAEAALDLYRCGARVTLVGRGEGLYPGVKYWLRPDLENRIREGSIRAVFGATVRAIAPGEVTLEAAGEPGRTVAVPADGPGGTVAVPADGPGRTVAVPADHVFLMTGFAPDYALLEGAGAVIDGGRPRWDPDTNETDTPGLFVAGVQADPTSIIEEGRFHGRRVAETLSRRLGR